MTGNAKIAVLGAGAWGTALAATLAGRYDQVTLWGRDGASLEAMRHSGRNDRYLPGIALPGSLNHEANLAAALTEADIVLAVIPAQSMRDTIAAAVDHIKADAIIVSCAKGIEQATGMTMTGVLAEVAPLHRHGVLSGPSFAADVVIGLPTAVTVAMGAMDQALDLARSLTTRNLRCYGSDDLAGVEYGGALKNVLAIAAGIVQGKGLGASALAALTTRGFAEMSRVTQALGGRAETLTGLSGLGDLILTCGSEKSRNFAYGAALGRGEPLAGLKLAEGVKTADIAARIVRDRNLEAPLIHAVHDVLAGTMSVDDAITTLLARPVKAETA